MRIHRLGLEIKNFKKNWIRIAPMKNSKIPSGLLSEKIPEVYRWVKDTLDQANLGSVPNNFTVVPAKESPKLGEPFDVLWVKFIIDESRWDDEVMWDIRYLLMGSKLYKIPGFPSGLNDIREKLYISRDGSSEKDRIVGGF